jgi:hypothetical protein
MLTIRSCVGDHRRVELSRDKRFVGTSAMWLYTKSDQIREGVYAQKIAKRVSRLIPTRYAVR